MSGAGSGGKVVDWFAPVDSIDSPSNYNEVEIKQALRGQKSALDPATIKQVLRAAGFRLPEQREVFNKEHLAEECQRIGFPLAMKVIGPLHKTDVGGVRLGIQDKEMASHTWSELMAIDEATGVLLQPTIDCLEVILGACQEGDFGHLVMFGLGGIHAEVF
ncbi:MAG: acetate--CoA ligase family protein [Proteobacteria bacterium]|nr:acetate--CoA ligase family protein [Pseudomonadota bacterium]